MNERTDPIGHGLQLLSSGRRSLNHSKYLLTFCDSRDEAEAKARASLRLLRSALDWLEDSRYAEEAHTELDSAGRFVRETFGCTLGYQDGQYWQECPVALAHTRIGLSVGMIEREVECSICHKDHMTCPHVTGRIYDGEQCYRIIQRFDATEVSFVSRPANPDCRVYRESVSTTGLSRALGRDFEVGISVSCDRCLQDCDGLREVEGLLPDHISPSGRVAWQKPEGAIPAGEATIRLM
jgi:hypothetical protein